MVMLGVSSKTSFFQKTFCGEHIDQYHEMLQKKHKRKEHVTCRFNFTFFYFEFIFMKSHLQTNINVSLLCKKGENLFQCFVIGYLDFE